MTLLEFIKSNLSKGTEVGRLCRDIQSDKKFPVAESTERTLSYIRFMSSMQKNQLAFKKFVKEFEKQSNESVDTIDLNARFALLKAENWEYYKQYFPVDKVILVGQPSDYYKVYCLDSSADRALFFDLKSSLKNLDEIEIKESHLIFLGNLSDIVSVQEALKLLNDCSYETSIKPDKLIFEGLIELLNLNK